MFPLSLSTPPVYSGALSQTESQKVRSQILVAMAMVLYKMNDLHQVKTTLFQR